MGGDDQLFGWMGNDTLEGGEGVDIFQFTDITHSLDNDTTHIKRYDVINDFTLGEDKIDLTGLGFTELITESSTSSADQLRLKTTNTSTYLNNDQTDFSIRLAGDLSNLTEVDLIFG
jgi:Ca2+-binding RTX toxin-like protein